MSIYDIAAGAGTSISTVLRVFNDEGDMNPRVRDRVEAVLKECDYKPNAIVRGMVSKTMKDITILTTDVRVTHYARMVYVVERELSNLGCNVSVCNTGDSVQEYNRYFEILPEKQTDGIMFIGSVFNELMKYPEITAKVKNTPVVVVNGQVKLPNFYSVLVDDAEAIRMASDYMFDHRRMGLFYVFDIATDSDRAKRQGFLEAVKLRDVPGGNDRVPEDIVTTGCNNSPGSRACEPELATLDNKPELLGGICAPLLGDRMEGKESAIGVAIQPELVMQESTSFRESGQAGAALRRFPWISDAWFACIHTTYSRLCRGLRPIGGNLFL